MNILRKRGRKPFIETKEGKKQTNKNKGYIRLLEDLEVDWPVMYKDDSIWNEYECFSDDLKYMVNQGFLFETESIEEPGGRTIGYYKLGIRGFEYLFMRRFNYYMIFIGVITILTFILTLFNLFN